MPSITMASNLFSDDCKVIELMVEESENKENEKDHLSEFTFTKYESFKQKSNSSLKATTFFILTDYPEDFSDISSPPPEHLVA